MGIKYGAPKAPLSGPEGPVRSPEATDRAHLTPKAPLFSTFYFTILFRAGERSESAGFCYAKL